MNGLKGKSWASTETSARKRRLRVNMGLLNEMGPWWQRIWKGTNCTEGFFTSVFPGKTVPGNMTPLGKSGKEVILWQRSFLYLWCYMI